LITSNKSIKYTKDKIGFDRGNPEFLTSLDLTEKIWIQLFIKILLISFIENYSILFKYE